MNRWVLKSEAAHMQAVRSVSKFGLARFMRRLARRDQHDFLVAGRFGDSACTDKVPVVNRIETSPQAQRFHIGEVYDVLTAAVSDCSPERIVGADRIVNGLLPTNLTAD